MTPHRLFPTLDGVRRLFAQVVRLLAESVSSFPAFVLQIRLRFGSGFRCEQHSDRSANSDAEQKVTDTIRIFHVAPFGWSTLMAVIEQEPEDNDKPRHSDCTPVTLDNGLKSCLMQAGDRSHSVTSARNTGRVGRVRFELPEAATAKADSSVALQSPDASVVPGPRAHISGDVGPP